MCTHTHTPPELRHEIFLLLLFGHLKALPSLVDVSDKTSLGGNVRRPVAEAEFCLKGVEVCLEVALLLGFGWLGDGGILTKLLESALSLLEGVVWHTVAEPRHGLGNPLEQLSGENNDIMEVY